VFGQEDDQARKMAWDRLIPEQNIGLKCESYPQEENLLVNE